MAIERKTVTKRNERHPAEALGESALEPSSMDYVAPPARTQEEVIESAPQPVPTAESPLRALATAPTDRRYETQSEGVADGPKVPTSFRIPRNLLDRLDKGARVIPAALDKNLSKNQLVENALDEYLKRFGV